MPVLFWVKRKALVLLRTHSDTNNPYKIAELGCGWGGALISLSKLYPHAEITGYETSFWPFVCAQFRSLFRKRISVRRENFFQHDLAGYDIVFCYLSPHHMKELKPQLERLKPGSLIVSCSFPIPGWTPVATETVGAPFKIPIFLYKAT